MHKKRITYIFLLIGLLGILSSIWVVDLKIQPQTPIQGVPFSAELVNSTITHTQEVERVVDLFEVSLDLTSSFPQATKVNMTITYSNATVQTYNLTESSDVWIFSTYFDYLAPFGTQSFKLFVYDDDLLLDDSYDQYFEIKNSPPKMAIKILNSTVYRNGTVFFNITPTDVETPYNDLSWSWQIMFGAVEMNASSGNPQLTDLTHFFPLSTTNSRLGEYSIKGVINDNDGGSTTTYSNFTLLNNVPKITAINKTFPDVLNPDRILRETEGFILGVNVSDAEVLPNDVDLRVLVHDALGNTVDKSGVMERSSPWHFEGNISLSKDKPIGEYTCEIFAYEDLDGTEYSTNQSFTFTLGNNIPYGVNISYTINDYIPLPSGSGLRIKEFEQISFAVNVTDVDIEGIEVIRIHLTSPSGVEYIYPFSNPENNYLEFSLSAKDLEYGQWTTWIYVVDFDGAEVHSEFSYPFDILPEQFNKVLPWVMLIVGAVIASGISMAVLGTRYITLRRNFDNLLSRSGDYKKSEPKSKKSNSPTPKTTPEEKKKSSAPSVSKTKKSSTKKHELFRKIKKK